MPWNNYKWLLQPQKETKSNQNKGVLCRLFPLIKLHHAVISSQNVFWLIFWPSSVMKFETSRNSWTSACTYFGDISLLSYLITYYSQHTVGYELVHQIIFSFYILPSNIILNTIVKCLHSSTGVWEMTDHVSQAVLQQRRQNQCNQYFAKHCMM